MPAKEKRVGTLLRKNRGISNMRGRAWLESEPLDRKNANKFLLGACMDYVTESGRAWDNARILVEIVLDDPDDLWGTIKSMGRNRLQDAFKGRHTARKCRRCKENHELIKTWDSGDPHHQTLHKLTNQVPIRILKITQNIIRHYDGDARGIWKGRPPQVVQSRLLDIGFGHNASYMAVDGLVKTRQIQDRGRLNMSLHVRRVLGRVFAADMVTEEEAHHIAETVEPGNTWAINWPLFVVGRRNCHVKEPDCQGCFLKKECRYHQNHKQIALNLPNQA